MNIFIMNISPTTQAKLFSILISAIVLTIALSYGWWNPEWHYRCRISFEPDYTPLKAIRIFVSIGEISDKCPNILSAKTNSLRIFKCKSDEEIRYRIYKWKSTQKNPIISLKDSNWPGVYSSTGINDVFRQQITIKRYARKIRICMETITDINNIVSFSICQQDSGPNCKPNTLKNCGFANDVEYCKDRCVTVKSKYCSSWNYYPVYPDRNYLITIDPHGIYIREAYLSAPILESGWYKGAGINEEIWPSSQKSTIRIHVWVEEEKFDTTTVFDNNDEIFFITSFESLSDRELCLYYDSEDKDAAQQLSYNPPYIITADKDGYQGIGQIFENVIYPEGTFGPRIRVHAHSSYNWGIGVGDFDNDGDYDFVKGGNDGYILFYENIGYREDRGQTIFSTPVNVGTFIDSGGSAGIAVNDFNKDGNLDFIITGLNNNYFVFLGDGTGRFEAKSPFIGQGIAYEKAACDFDSDGCPDFAVGTSSSNKIFLWKGQCDGSFRIFDSSTIAVELPSVFTLTCADFDMDGNIDIIAGSGDSYSWYFFKGIGNANFNPGEMLFDKEDQRTAITTTDVNRDKIPDIVSTTVSSEHIYYYQGRGDGGLYPQIKIAFTGGNELGGISAPSPYLPLKLDHESIIEENLGKTCYSDSDCANGHCSFDYDGNGRFCAPLDICVHEEYGNLFIAKSEHSYSTYYCYQGNWLPKYQDNHTCEYDYQCISDICATDNNNNKICCSSACVYNGVCYSEYESIENLYCANGRWNNKKPEKEICFNDVECLSGICARDIHGEISICCNTPCSLYPDCIEAGTDQDNLYCHPKKGWVPKETDNSLCQQDSWCKGNRCVFIGNLGICCSYPSCLLENGTCLPETSVIGAKYCSGGEWHVSSATNCTEDYQCINKNCAADLIDPNHKFCCITDCVYNGICYEVGSGIKDYYCDYSKKWSEKKDNLSPCVSDIQCKSGYCDYLNKTDSEKLCLPINDCVYNHKIYASNKTHFIGSHPKFCLNRKWYDCSTDNDCLYYGIEFWCNKHMCVEPVCGNNRCDIISGECNTTCKDCSFEQCNGDGICNPARGENCLNSIDCKCNPTERCKPGNQLSNEIGCVEKKCDDNICDVEIGECELGCVGCNITICKEDPLCNVKSGENCLTQPEQCKCPDGWECLPGNPLSTEIGCFSPGCGNNICEPERGECKNACPDCKLENCSNDGICITAGEGFKENCRNSPDCSCENNELCAPDDIRADSRGCVKVVCGDNICEGFESCLSCRNDCGHCLTIAEPRKKVMIYTGDKKMENITIKNTANITLSLKIEVSGYSELVTPLNNTVFIVRPEEEKTIYFSIICRNEEINNAEIYLDIYIADTTESEQRNFVIDKSLEIILTCYKKPQQTTQYNGISATPVIKITETPKISDKKPEITETTPSSTAITNKTNTEATIIKGNSSRVASLKHRLKYFEQLINNAHLNNNQKEYFHTIIETAYKELEAGNIDVAVNKINSIEYELNQSISAGEKPAIRDKSKYIMYLIAILIAIVLVFVANIKKEQKYRYIKKQQITTGYSRYNPQNWRGYYTQTPDSRNKNLNYMRR